MIRRDIIKNFRFMIKDNSGCFYFLTFKIFRLKFLWFKECGDWFIYFNYEDDYKIKNVRFSSAGFINDTINKGEPYEVGKF